MSIAKEILRSSGYWVLNKAVVKTLGVETAFFLINLVEAEELMQDNEGWFYQTIETVEEVSGLSRREQTRAIKALLDNSLIEQTNRGIPMKRYFRINYNKIAEMIESKRLCKNVQNVQTIVCETDKLERAKRTTSKERNKQHNNIYTLEFEELYQTYPRAEDKRRTFNNYKKLLKEYTHEELLKSCINYKAAKQGTDIQYLKSSANFFGKERIFEDYIDYKPIEEQSIYRDLSDYEV